MRKLFSILIGATFTYGEHNLCFYSSPSEVLIHGFVSVEWLKCAAGILCNNRKY